MVLVKNVKAFKSKYKENMLIEKNFDKFCNFI